MPGPIGPQPRDALPAAVSLPDAGPISNQETVLTSPVTPGINLQPSVSLANNPDAPAALPSPVPNTSSHPSPVVAQNPASSPPTDRRPLAVPQTGHNEQNAMHPSQHATVPQQNPTVITAAPPCGQHSASPGPPPPSLTNDFPLQSPTDRSSFQSPSLIPAGPGNVRESADVGSRPIQQAPTAMQPSGLILPGDETWAQWKTLLEYLKKEAQKSPAPKLAGPRIRLLVDACEYKDLLFLVLHQLYCQQSLDDKGHQEFPMMRDQICQTGLVRVQELIEPNIPMGWPMTWKLARFPQPLEELKHQAWYRVAVGKVVHCLTRLATSVAENKAHLFDSVYRRGYPPTVAELLGFLDATSPVLMTIIFASKCRSLYEDKSMAKLNKLFRRDLWANLQGRPSNLTEEYKKIPLMPRPVPLMAPVPPSSASPAVPRPVARAPSTGSQAAIASPVISVHSNPRSGQSSPRGLANSNVPAPQIVAGGQLQSPVYQHSPYLPPEQPTRQGQTAPGQLPQMQRFWYQGQCMQYNLPQMQHPAPGQPQPGDYGHTQRAQQGTVQAHVQSPRTQQSQAQTQQALHAQMQHSQMQTQHPTQAVMVSSNVSPITSNSLQQPQPISPWYGQIPPQTHQRSARPSCITAQSDPRQIPSIQNPRTHLSGQGQLPPHRRQSSRSLANAPQQYQGQGSSAQQLPQPGQQLPHNPRVQLAPFRPLLQPPGHQLPETVSPNPTYMALHQADLREPEKRLVEFGPNKEMTEAQLFQYLGDLVLQPKVIDPKELRYDLRFILTDDVCGRFPRLEHAGIGKRPKQIIQPGCFIFRLRCITLCPSEQENSERLWSTKNTVWPSVLYIFVNEKEMFLRRKAHNGKDLPLDISEHLRPGLNTVTIHLLLRPDECKTFNYVFGIESMYISKFESVRDLAGNTTADQTRLSIQKRLTAEDSDDLAVVTDSLKISLIDPFMAQIFKTPVRARDCEHLECFDHETFIITRKNVSGFAALNDNWRCPICNADARPQLLCVDKFFLAVRDYLVATDNLDGANAIEVKADGSWTLQAIRDESPNAPRSPRVEKSLAPALGKRKGDNTEQGSDATRPKYEYPLDRGNSSQPTEPVLIEID
ncbi:transcriptional regulator family: Zinc finger MIZ-type [Penicillium atrosanguineum]|uniref:uncharacterized protein n=1 Tax=Penicillium atrosanguineum TaxID=1132637 RepID=UPI00238CC16C|nr:uncharacterized protein N7443_010132 [Penicillium atrosanguineum]KAJ5132214.1 transcriptional regulator family: Zinc finger MIZ-type [Penicillium atrosanguineum]KAJ5289879.1 hypothetical protein N7443_010132 [Penicillium atrosanguineum]